jgi:RNase adaptor protein for sRNA GlmZ degradation
LRWLLQNVELPVKLPALTSAFASITSSEKLRRLTFDLAAMEAARAPATEKKTLTVRIFSFSFRRGIPKDETGHGGGFVFDARSIQNPGREERFKALTGKDAPVIEYLDEQKSAHQFLAGVTSLVDASVSTYRSRGFTSLTVSFGCTGGQHRSVYLAEHLAAHLRQQGGVDVVVRHLELENMQK